ncbi:TetR/AcrR family transcriptional regulator [uncultured Lutibacter sp.]|uniref:TetR/AcrR family transcriptional regulator n=1 Tax=uncultured Lutibacter sp. TaxID=437739 RepID=UPI002636343C|nr:TetR/AcrR family transcriptional regulator [uncultured Lutibacter sp.]
MEDSTSEIIIETASKKFRQYGLHSLSMDDLAKFCGVSKKTIYKYFQNKSDLIDTILDKKIEFLKTDFEELHSVSKNAVSEMYCFLNMINDFANDLPTALHRDLKKYHLNLFVKYNHVQNDVYKPFIVRNLERGKQEALYNNDFNIENITKSILDVIDMIFIEGLRNDRASIKTVEFFENMLIHKIATIKGLKKLNALIEE